MAIRSLINKLEDFEFYSSTFDTTTGVLVRKVTVPERPETKRYGWAPEPTLVGEWAKSKGISTRDDYPSKGPYYDLQLKWAEKFGRVIQEEGEPPRPSLWTADWRTKVAFSPVPETIDVKITDWCNFGCNYCLTPETRVLRQDGQWVPIQDVQEGDVLLGFEEHRVAKNKHRKVQRADVLHKWKTQQPEVLIELSSGQLLRTSPNHLWLTDRSGWLPTSRLRPGMSLKQIPTWGFSDPTATLEFRRGYLAGLSWGDGTFQFEQTEGQIYWRVAVKDIDILQRAAGYLESLDIEFPGIKPFDSGTESAAEMFKVEVRNRSGLAKLRSILEEAKEDSGHPDFLTGFVSGFFDAEGSLSGSNLRVSQKNHLWALEKMAQVMSPQFSFERESERADGVHTYRLTNSSYWDVLRFFATYHPACERKYPDLHGTELLSEKVKIVSVQETGRFVEMVDITTSSHTFFAEGIATHNCYMDSTTRGNHAPKSLLSEIFLGLDEAPYQIAYGGGEPTAHPDFPWFLEVTRKSGSVPNYTTAGHILRDDVFDATNKYCGGVALTYHAFKGPEYFKKTYETWRKRLDPRVQINVHVIFDKDVADNLLDLKEIGLTNLQVVLLAYYPEVGRSTWSGTPTKGVYEVTLPAALKTVTEAGFKIAFSEGLLPYFLSHQFPEVNTTFACQQEGLFSCYVDDKGRVSHSSFSPASDEDKTSIYTTRFQEIWNKLSHWSEHFDPCSQCEHKASCHIPHESHYLLCKFAEHNQRMPSKIPVRRTRLPVVS